MSENCSCGSRLIVDASVKDALLEKVKAGISTWKLGDPRDEDVVIGPMVEGPHFEKVKGFIATTEKEGGVLVQGGKIHSELGSGWYIEPTIFDKVTADMTLFQQEVFGPILAVTTFESEEQAVALANDSSYGLAASLYTENLKRAQRVSRAIRAGTVSINGFSEGDITTPFGGFKQSGFGGRDKGLEALQQYVQTKTIWYVQD